MVQSVRFLQRLAFVVLPMLGVIVDAIAPDAAAQASSPPARNFAQEISRARGEWTRDSNKIARLLGELRTKLGALDRTSAEVKKLRKELNALTAEKRQALEDLRNGAFCTGCSQTRSVLLAQGDPFPHPGQESRPATPEELKRAEDDYNNRIARLRARLSKAESEERQAKAEMDSALHELNVTIPEYHRNLLQEQSLRAAAWGQEKQSLETALEALLRSLETATEASRSTRSPEAGEAAALHLRIQRRQFDDKQQQASAAESRARQDAQTFANTATRDLARLGGLAAPLPERFGFPGGWFLSRKISIPPLGIGYTVLAVRRFEPSGSDSVRDLLNSGGATRKPGEKAGTKSVRDLLEGS